MKKFSAFLASFLILASAAYAFPPVWLASHTITADSTQILCKGSTYLINTSTVTQGEKGILHGVCVNDAAGGGTVTIYNSSSTAVNPVAIIRSTSAVNMGCLMYDIQLSSGLVYSTSLAGNDVTILYQCY